VYRIRISRSFKNLSGADIIIREVGLVARSYWKGCDAINDLLNRRNDVTYMIARDVLPQDYVVPDGGSALVSIVVEVVLG